VPTIYYFTGQDGGQVGNGTALLCDGNAWMAKIPAAASASQSEKVSFFMLILLEFLVSKPRNRRSDP
jgi:hypothetical protein